jgi:hypothetical protein
LSDSLQLVLLFQYSLYSQLMFSSMVCSCFLLLSSNIVVFLCSLYYRCFVVGPLLQLLLLQYYTATSVLLFSRYYYCFYFGTLTLSVLLFLLTTTLYCTSFAFFITLYNYCGLVFSTLQLTRFRSF